MESAVARAYSYNGGLGQCGTQGQSLWSGGQGRSSSEAEALLVYARLMEAAIKLAHFSKIWKRKEITYLCYLCQKS